MTSLTSLPTETICSIAGKLELADLLRLSLVCRHVSGPALRQVYAHPRVGSWTSGEMFRIVHWRDREAVESQLVSFTCTDWLAWGGWFAGLEPLANLRHVSIGCGPESLSWWHQTGDPTSPLSLAWILRAMSTHPGLSSLYIVGPTSVRIDPEARPSGPLVHLTELSLLEVFLDGENPFPPELSVICPNVRRLSLELEDHTAEHGVGQSQFHPGTLDFVASFASLQSLALAGIAVAVDGRGFREVLPRLRRLSLCLSRARDVDPEAELGYPLPPCLFDSTFDNLQSLYLRPTRLASRTLRALATRLASRTPFPSLRRFKLVTPDPPQSVARWLHPRLLKSFDHSVARLRRAGFICHLCPVIIYAERPSATRCALDSPDQSGRLIVLPFASSVGQVGAGLRTRSQA